MGKHTPTPWKTTYQEASDNGYRQIIFDEATGQHIAYCAWYSIPTETGVETNREANAEFIVRACNGWYDLDALRARVQELEAGNG